MNENKKITDDNSSREIAELKNTIIEQNEIISRLNAKLNEYKSKEASISNAIIAAAEKAKQMEEASKKLYQIEIQRNRLLYMRLEQVLNELHTKYPDLKMDNKINDLSTKFKSLLNANYENLPTKDFLSDFKSINREDPIKKMLSKITNYCDVKQKPSTEIVRNDVFHDEEPLLDMKEALNPTLELDDILKAFDLGGGKPKRD